VDTDSWHGLFDTEAGAAAGVCKVLIYRLFSLQLPYTTIWCGLTGPHRAVKRVTRPMLGFKAFETAQAPLAGITLMPMITKRP